MSSSPRPDAAALGAAVVFLRNLWGWSQSQLAERSGLHDSQISRWERGSLMPRTSSLRRLAHALEVPERVLLDLQQTLLSYLRDQPVELDRLLRHSGSTDPVAEVREIETAPYSADRDAIHQRWQELARDRAALEQRQILLLRDTILFDLGRHHRASDGSPIHN